MHELAAMLRVLDPEWPHESISKDLSNFNLQNGAEQLSAWFNEVALLAYEDSLAVTQTKPLVDYLLSTMHGQQLADYAEHHKDFAKEMRKDCGIYGPQATRTSGN
jgi:hypothetical protein